mmetsp:Transcript_18708/g.28677  ORF Transcript_18708/g.28677 Transcript_18708/m.28677 type:complete len:87 (+) Transcript_18708:1107-1367(+)
MINVLEGEVDSTQKMRQLLSDEDANVMELSTKIHDIGINQQAKDKVDSLKEDFLKKCRQTKQLMLNKLVKPEPSHPSHDKSSKEGT